MKWSDRAIILSSRKFGENSAIVHLITADHGMYAGVDRGALSKSKRGIYQPGNIVSATWQARLPEQLGMISAELEKPVAALIMDNAMKLDVINSATSVIEKTLLEREKQQSIFKQLEILIHSLMHDGDYLADYVRLEFALLSHSGFGVDIERCAATGQTHDLSYVSPKSGRAVSREAGQPYHHKLLALPSFLQSANNNLTNKIHISEILDGIRLCGYFFNERIFTHRNITMPPARLRLVDALVTA